MIFQKIASYAGSISAIVAAATILIRPLRERIFGIRNITEGLKCQLRSDMLRSYYMGLEKKTIRQYALENFIACYKAYKALHGNSFMDKVYNEVMTWTVVS